MTNLNVPGLDLTAYMREVGERARAASRTLAGAGTSAKDDALLAMARAVRRDEAKLLAANARDIAAAKASGCDAAFIDRLTLSAKSIATMADGLEQIATLRDPVGEISELRYRPTGIQVGKMRVPLGVVGIIYESRPNVTADAAALCLKSGNATILRGGSEASRSRGLPDHRHRTCGRHHPARWQGAHRAHHEGSEGAGHQASGRRVPRVYR